MLKSGKNIRRLHGEPKYVLLLRAKLDRRQSALCSQIVSGSQDIRGEIHIP